MNEYTTRQLANRFGTNVGAMHRLLNEFDEAFGPRVKRVPVGGQILTSYFQTSHIEPLIVRFIEARRGNEPPINTFRRMFNKPKKTAGKRNGPTIAVIDRKLDEVLELIRKLL